MDYTLRPFFPLVRHRGQSPVSSSECGSSMWWVHTGFWHPRQRHGDVLGHTATTHLPRFAFFSSASHRLVVISGAQVSRVKDMASPAAAAAPNLEGIFAYPARAAVSTNYAAFPLLPPAPLPI